VNPRNAIHLLGEPSQSRIDAYGNRVNLSTLLRWVPPQPYPPVWQHVLGVTVFPPGTILAVGFDLGRGHAAYVHATTDTFPRQPGIVAVCTRDHRRGLWVEARTCGGSGSPAERLGGIPREGASASVAAR
jgi:hypothetical protein